MSNDELKRIFVYKNGSTPFLQEKIVSTSDNYNQCLHYPSQVETVNTIVDRVNSDTMDHRFAKLEQMILNLGKQLNERIDKLNERIDEMDARITGLANSQLAENAHFRAEIKKYKKLKFSDCKSEARWYKSTNLIF
jgi:tRNA(Ser,Leu) C12 N-acetylase TAN1